MKYRKLRIAWSVGWGILAVLLCVVWVRSYFGAEYFYWNYKYHQSAVMEANRGRVVIYGGAFTLGSDSSMLDFRRIAASRFSMVIGSRESSLPSFADHRPIWTSTFVLGPGLAERAIIVWVWLPVTVAAVFAGAPWLRQLPYRFSLRTLLIATTLVAVTLGLIVWPRR